jgi:hypothetical protein
MIEVQKLDHEISFRVSGDILQQIYDWEYSIDEKVFKEQLTTGYYRGRYEINDDLLHLMRLAEKEGKILPYYGVGGSSGSCAYSFRLISSKCLIIVENTSTADILELAASIILPEKPVDMKRVPKFKFSILPLVTDEELPEPWNEKPDRCLVCKIVGKEYQNLITWKNWVDEKALTARYIYRFGQVSLGATGFTVKVKDTETDDIIDATDYGDW